MSYVSFTPKIWVDESNPLGPPANPLIATPFSAAGITDLERRVTNWASMRTPIIPIYASGDTTGVTDDNNFYAAVAALPYGGVICPVGNQQTPFYTACTHTVVNGLNTRNNLGWVPPTMTVVGGDSALPSGQTAGGPVCIQGIGFPILCPVKSNGVGIYYHRTQNFGGGGLGVGGGGDYLPSGFIRDIMIAGWHAKGAAIGLDCGDLHMADINQVQCVDFDGPGGVGFAVQNDQFFTEKSNFRVWAWTNETQVYITKNSGASDSMEYNDWNFAVQVHTNQTGIVIDNASLGGGRMLVRGTCQAQGSGGNPSAVANPLGRYSSMRSALITFLNGGRFFNGDLQIKTEPNQAGSGSTYPYGMMCDGKMSPDGSHRGGLAQMSGHISTGLNSGWNMDTGGGNGADVTFGGMFGPNDVISNAGNLGPSVWAPPVWQNTGPDRYLTIAASGTITSVLFNGVALVNPTAGMNLYVPTLSTVEIDGGTPGSSTGFPTTRMAIARLSQS
jgi:hypothetical protein